MTTMGRDLEVVVRQIRAETADIRSFRLERPEGGTLPPFQPGAHVEVEPVPGLVRHYSLAGDPADLGQYLLGVKKVPQSRGGSSAMHSLVHEGSLLRISHPKNNFVLKDRGGRRLLMAGGIGVTPLLAMAAALHRHGTPFELHYFIRTKEDLAFRALVAGADWADKVLFHMGLVPPALNDTLQVLLAGPGAEDQIYMCGPAPFMDTVRETALAAGWPIADIFFELFSAAPPVVSAESEDFIVRLTSTGQEVSVRPGQTIVEALRDAGVEIETSCEQGICGTCVTRCLEGEPEHHDFYLSDDERAKEGLFTPCVSRAKTKFLVIDR